MPRWWSAPLAGACSREATVAGSEPVAHAPVATTASTIEATTTTTTTTDARDHPPAGRVVTTQAWVPYASAGPVVLHHVADRIESIGFHESARDGAQPLTPLSTSVSWFTMDTRARDTDPRSASDIVVEPDREIRAPVTGTVLRAGTYTLYCDHVDQYAVIEPDARPGWEVKVLHVEGLALVQGQRVEAGVTRVAARARVLPFPSQVEESTGLPPWPHVHVEVVDPTLPDRTGPGCT